MANIVFNIAKGRVVEYYNRVKSNDNLFLSPTTRLKIGKTATRGLAKTGG